MAEIAAMTAYCGGVNISASDRCSLRIHTENRAAAVRFCNLLSETFPIQPETGVRQNGAKMLYSAAVASHSDTLRILKSIHVDPFEDQQKDPSQQLPEKTCCRRAYLRGAFLSCGSISDPAKHYHLEMVCPDPESAGLLETLMRYFEMEPGMVQRKGHFVIYLKEGSQIADLLRVIDAPKALMNMENIRILREISNDVNRRVNCEAANISKTVSASVRQVEDIRFLLERMKPEELPAQLHEMAMIRLKYQDLPLQELGSMMTPPLGKSGVNHRLKKLSAMAAKLRGGNGDSQNV